jgi:hypothetical protein
MSRSEDLLDQLRQFPSHEILSEAFGFHAPDFLVRLIQFFWKRANADASSCIGMIDEAFGFFLVNSFFRYHLTPPELFPFASLGVDGVHYGCVVYLPDLAAPSDYPVGELCPMDPDGVFQIGSDMKEALENFLAKHYEDVADRRLPPVVHELAAAMDLCISRGRNRPRYDDCGKGLPIKQEVPPGWRFHQSSDGVGVLAPAELFAPEPVDKGSYGISPETFLHGARIAQSEGFLATALCHLREGYWYHWTAPDWLRRYSVEMIGVYEALGRPRLAGVVSQRLDRFGK